LDDARHLGVTLSDLADALIKTNRAQEAIRALDEADRNLADSPDPHSRGRVLTRLGQAHELAGDLPAGADYLHESLRTMREIGSRQGEADALVALGDLAARAGRRDEAQVRYAEAQRVFVSLGSPEAAQVRDRLRRLDQPGQA
jgi:tetratricopeptide (TPR) repeat protein